MKKALLLSTCLLQYTLYAQQELPPCGYEQYEKKMMTDQALKANADQTDQTIRRWIDANRGALQKTNAPLVTVPVVFHVIWNSAKPTQNIVDLAITDNLQTLNEDFRRLNTDTSSVPGPFKSLIGDANIEFCLAKRDPQGNSTTGILRQSTTHSPFYDYYYQGSCSCEPMGTYDHAKFDSLGGQNGWPADQYLNIWIVDIAPGVNGSSAGVNAAIQYDGVLMDYTVIKKGGRTLTHEVGHWFGLYHIWAYDGCTVDDQISDTPMQDKLTGLSSCPSFPKLDACTSTGNGIMYMNYMDYSSCQYMFSVGQANWMQSLLNTNSRRTALKNSMGCVPPSPTGISDAGGQQAIRIYPTLSEGSVMINFNQMLKAKAEILVKDMLGRNIKQLSEIQSGPTMILNLSDLTPGTYLIHVKTSDAELYQKIILATPY